MRVDPRVVLGAAVIFVACSKKEAPQAQGTAALAPTTPTSPSADNSPRGLCQRGCTKILGCAGGQGDAMAACIEQCAAGSPQQAQIEQIEATSCEQLLAGGGVPANGGAGGQGNGCTADCRGCVGDNSSCYAVAGGANGIPCDPCCCAAGGPSPTWRTQ